MIALILIKESKKSIYKFLEHWTLPFSVPSTFIMLSLSLG